MKTYDNSINTIQDRTFTFERKIAYRNGDPYIISSELHDPQLVFSLASSKFVKDEKFFKEFYCSVAGNYPTFYQTTPEVIAAEPGDKSIYFKTGEDKSFCVFKWAGHDPEYFYYGREAVVGEALDRPYARLNYWTDGEHHYLSEETSFEYDDDEEHYEHWVLDENGAWAPKVWNGYTAFDAYAIWSYKGNIYCSSGSLQFVLNKSTSTWEEKVWNNAPSFFGNDVWVDEVEDKVYINKGNNCYVLDEDTWESMDWGEIKPGLTFGIWHQGENYYSNRYISVNGQTQIQNLVLNRSSHTWEEKIWNIPSSLENDPTIQANNIWHNGEDCYYSDLWGNNFVLDEDTDSWEEKIWSGLPLRRFDESEVLNSQGDPYLSAESTWDWNGKIYYSAGTVQYVLNNDTWEPYRWPTTYIISYNYEEVPYEFKYKLDFPYNITKQFQGIDYVYDLKVVAGISNYEYLVNLLHMYRVDEETFTITIGANTYIFSWNNIGEEWLVNGEKASLLLLLAFAKSYEVESYIGEDLVNIYLKELALCKVEEPIVDPDYVEYILKPTAFNVSSCVKGAVK